MAAKTHDRANQILHLLLQKGTSSVEAEGLVGQLAGQLDPAMSAMDQAALFELDEVAPDAGCGGIDGGGEVFDAAGALLQQQMKDLICTIMSLCSHFRGFLSSEGAPTEGTVNRRLAMIKHQIEHLDHLFAK